MNEQERRARDLLRTLVPHGFKRDRTDTRAFRYTGTLTAAGRTVAVAITFSDLEFTRLPQVTLLHPEQEAPHVVAHLMAEGGLCFARDDDVVLDRYDVGGTALTCLELARRGLERALTHKHLEHEIAQEFPQHWFGVPFYYDLQAKKDATAHLHNVPRHKLPGCLVLTDTEAALKRFVPSKADRSKIVAHSTPVFVFRSETNLTFTTNQRPPENLAAFLEWLHSVLPKSRERAISEIASPFPKAPSAVFVNAPNACVGIRLDARPALFKAAQRLVGFKRLLDANAEKVIVQRYFGTRFDNDFIFKRNMTQKSSLTGRRLAVLGCGTIGGLLAKFLVHSGAGHGDGTLLLLDNQRLEPGNIGRHFLGMNSIGEHKADGLKAELGRQFADAHILAMRADAVSFLDNLADYELVIDATGEEALSASINHHFIARRAAGKSPDVLHIRLFGNGAAAQALLVDGSQYACFKCLKPDHDGEWRFNPLKPDIAPVQTAAACGEGQYIAYGIAAPAMAAAVGLQLALDWNSGNPAPRMRTIRVEKKDTREIADKNPERSQRCPACGGSPT